MKVSPCVKCWFVRQGGTPNTVGCHPCPRIEQYVRWREQEKEKKILKMEANKKGHPRISADSGPGCRPHIRRASDTTLKEGKTTAWRHK
jgi:hypothetical protein